MKTKIIIAVLLLGFVISAKAQKKIKTTELPKPAQEFLEKHFSYTTVEVAKKDAEHGEKGYEVKLKDGTEVEFWKDGSYREVDGDDKPIPTDFIPASVKDYVSKNYPNEKITVTSQKSFFRFGKLKCDVIMKNESGQEVCKGILAGMITNKL